jgi:hypothetical protein
MFALKEIINEKLYAIAIGEANNVFRECFENWQDVKYLHNYFKENEEALKFYNVERKKAVQLVLQESRIFYEDILDIANGTRNVTSLDESIFIPLHKYDDFDIPLLKTKAYGKEKGLSFLRMYALRLQDGTYIVVGGLIKTTEALQDCEEGRKMLTRIKEVAKFLEKNNFTDAFDIVAIVI